MELKGKLTCLTALIVLAIPFAFMVSTAGAVYVGDGSKQNGTYGDWDITNYGVCVTGITSDGTIVTDPSKTSRPDCLTVKFPDDASLTSQAACTGDSDANGGSHYWASTCSAPDGTRISMKDLDRTAANCDKRAKALGYASGTWASKCTGSWIYTGPLGDGTPGFCYTRVELTGAGYTSTTCPTGTPGYVWDTTHVNCDFLYGIAGNVDANITKKNGTAGPVRGTFVDLSVYTQGQCLVNGYSWSTGTTKSGTTTVATTPQTSSIAVATGTRAGCLECHNTASQNNSYAERWKETYLMTGHKNMLRKVTPGNNYAGPDGGYYTAAAGGQTLNFSNGTVTGTYGTKTLMYLFGDWMMPAPDGLDLVVDMGGGVAKYNGTSGYSCAACHTTGWSNSAAGLCSLSSKTTQAACTSAGGTWYPSTGVQGTTGAEPKASFPSYMSGITGTWDKDGILCSRCHASTFPAISGVTDTHNVGTSIVGQNVTNLCFGCHQSLAKASNGTGTDVDLTITGKIPVANNATAPAYVPKYSGHVIGDQFLNSPHARFSGTVTPNTLGKYDLTTNDKSQYNSTFNGYVCRSNNSIGGGSILKTYVDSSNGSAKIIKNSTDCSTAGGYWVAAGGASATAQGSCTTCHDVHQSIVPEVNAAEPIVRECTTCHVDQAASYPALTAVTNIRHPAGTGTPRQNEATAPSSSCETCHMPSSANGDLPSHLFRISVDPTYSTFPTAAEFGIGGTATKKIANTAPDGSYTNAVWSDIDIACGQCHGATGTAHALNKQILAGYAAGMHSGGTGTSFTCADCHANVTPAHPAATGAPAQCSDCHGATRAGVQPTVQAACLTCHGPTGAAHLFTATQIAPYAQAIHAGGGAPSTTCTVCHADYPAALIDHPITTCVDCHAGTRPGVAPTSAQACNPCHGGSSGRASVKVGAPLISQSSLVKYAKVIHRNVPPVASMHVDLLRVLVNATVTVTDTSTDQNQHISLITVGWGDGTFSYILAGESATHSYATAGTKTIVLTATSMRGLKSTARQKITVVNASVGNNGKKS